MVSAISSVPYSYYNVLNPTAATTAPATGTPATGTTATTPATPATTPIASGSTDPGSDSVKLSSLVVSLLQQLAPNSSSTSGSSLGALLGASSNSMSAKIYSDMLQAAYSGAIQKSAAQTTSSSGVQNALDSYHSGANAASAQAISQNTQPVGTQSTPQVISA